MNKTQKIELVKALLDEFATIGVTTNINHKTHVLELAKELLEPFHVAKNPTIDEVNLTNVKVILSGISRIASPDKVVFFCCHSLELALTELLK
jgi:hypothetical protein